MGITAINSRIRTILIGVLVGMFVAVCIVGVWDMDCEASGQMRHERDSIKNELRMREDTIIMLDLKLIRQEREYQKEIRELQKKIDAYKAEIDSVYHYTPAQLDSFFRSRYHY